MGRLRPDFVERVEAFVHQMLDVVALLEARSIRSRLLDQIAAASTSVGANICEADFVKCLSIASKELSETRFWLRLCSRRGWIPQDSAVPVLAESNELQRILSSMISRSRLRRDTPNSVSQKPSNDPAKPSTS
jgi:four helix bundle protein